MGNFVETYGGIFIALGVVLVILLCDFLIRSKIQSSSEQHIFFRLLKNVRYPLLIAMIVGGFLLSLKSSTIYEKFWALCMTLEVVLIGCIGWVFIRIIKTVENHCALKEENYSFVIGVLTTVTKSALLLVVGLMILDKLNVNISGILAVGGIGGVVIGLASKDLFSSFFGFITILLDRPFKVGDLIYSSDRNIMGVVDKITWRFTRVITLEKKPMYIPNAIFSTIVIQNESEVLARRIDEVLKFEFRESEMIPQFTKEMNLFLENNELLNQQFKATFNVSKIGSGVVGIRLIAYTKARVWTEFSSTRQEILLAIFETARKMDLKPMYPETEMCLYDSR
ncbi:mechanosensitive ion channel family protein [Neorickettsia sennetsu str. Miyayama]|uniref:Mechanosensitive ion channel family protein n=2 Tax=Ehrlichia sennetsu TaxID=951 RepID=Q2GCT1_EHRS3|nr:mechanosensitive ion channel family protein [Neorickettsia sennetsu str. Miyayama]